MLPMCMNFPGACIRNLADISATWPGIFKTAHNFPTTVNSAETTPVSWTLFQEECARRVYSKRCALLPRGGKLLMSYIFLIRAERLFNFVQFSLGRQYWKKNVFNVILLWSNCNTAIFIKCSLPEGGVNIEKGFQKLSNQCDNIEAIVTFNWNSIWKSCS